MINDKVVFVIPGYKQHPKNKAYKEIAKILKSEGYYPILVNILWRKTTISQNTEYFLKKYKKINTKKKYILGFSFGAMIAFLASTKVSVSGLVLCSLSPYFQEDLSLGSRYYRNFSNLHCGTLARKVRAKQIHMLYGTREERSLKKRVTEAYDQISSVNKYLIPIRKTEHDIGHIRYLNKIHKVTKDLN